MRRLNFVVLSFNAEESYGGLSAFCNKVELLLFHGEGTPEYGPALQPMCYRCHNCTRNILSASRFAKWPLQDINYTYLKIL